ncbi:alpha/beta fold hydrolase [Streptomyces chiangmaiensis]
MERRLRLPYFWDAMARSARGIVNAYTLGGQHALWRQAERVLAPTLLVYGGRDQLVSFRMAQRASRAFRDSRLLTLPEAGHVAMMEYPDVVTSAFRELLADTGGLPETVGGPENARDGCGAGDGDTPDGEGSGATDESGTAGAGS